MTTPPNYVPMQMGLQRQRITSPTGFSRDRGMMLNASGQPSYFGEYKRVMSPMAQGQGPLNQPMPAPMPGRMPDFSQFQGQPIHTLPYQMNGQPSPASGSAPVGSPHAISDRMQTRNWNNSGPMGDLRDQQRAAWSGQPRTGGGLTVEGGPNMYRDNYYHVPTASGPRGPLSTPPMGRGSQIRNMQSRINEYNAGRDTNAEWDQNKLNRMQGRLNYLQRTRGGGM